MKRQADNHRRDVQFEVGDRVYLKLRPYRQQSVARRVNEKLAPKYYGPFVVLEKIGAVAYKLQLPPSSLIHPVFHVSQLRKAIGEGESLPTLPTTLTEDMMVMMTPETLEGVREGRDGRKEVRVTWKGLPGYEATWESFDGLRQQFPEFNLEDKVSRWAGSNDAPVPHDAPVPLKTYVRRKQRD